MDLKVKPQITLETKVCENCGKLFEYSVKQQKTRKFCCQDCARKYIARNNVGRRHTEETKEKIRISHLGDKNPQYNKPLTEEHKQKIRESHKKRGVSVGERNGMFGKKTSEETKQKIRESLVAVGANVGEKNGMFGKVVSEEVRKHLSEVQKGRKFSESHIQHLKEARKYRLLPFRDTKIETRLQGLLEQNEVTYEKHKPIVGQPDLFIAPNICIFADGKYWHASPKIYDSKYLHAAKKKTAQEIWDYDANITQALVDDGYTVLRFWEDDINNNIEQCWQAIKEALCKIEQK